LQDKPTYLQSFFRSQIGSSLATLTDFIVFLILDKIFGVYYVIATTLGNIVGAIVSFFLGRHWAFKNKDGSISKQATRYIITSSLSSLLNTGLLILIVEVFKADPFYGKLIASFFVGVTFNFFMFKHYVFK
jgi:putative flippase GtrA